MEGEIENGGPFAAENRRLKVKKPLGVFCKGKKGMCYSFE